MARPWLVYLGTSAYPTEETAGTAAPVTTFTETDWIEPLQITHVGNGEISELRFICHKHPEEAWTLIPTYTAIQVRTAGGSTVFSGVVMKRPFLLSENNEIATWVAWSHGDRLLHDTSIWGTFCRSFSREQHYFNVGPGDNSGLVFGTDVNLVMNPTIFNPEGAPNRTNEGYTFTDPTLPTDHTVFLFEAPFRNQVDVRQSDDIVADYWTLKDAVGYLLNTSFVMWLSNMGIDPASFNDTALNAAFNVHNPVVSNVVVQGNSLLQALQKLLEPHNYTFTVSPALGTHGHTINFYYRTAGPTASFRLSPRDTHTLAGTSNLKHIDFIEDASAVENTIFSFGNQVVWTTLAHTNPPAPSGNGHADNYFDIEVMTLVPGWDTTNNDLLWDMDTDASGTPLGTVNTHSTRFIKYYCNPDLTTPIAKGQSDGPNYAFGVGRYWLVNQGQSNIYALEQLSHDLDDSGDTTHNDGSYNRWQSMNLRQFERPEYFTHASNESTLQKSDIIVEMSVDSGTHWGIVEKQWYRMAREGMGVIFTPPELDMLGTNIPVDDTNNPGGIGYWQALHDGHLQIRVLCSVKSDERVHATRANGGLSIPLARERVFDSRGYNRVNYNAQAPGALYFSNYQPLAVNIDDTQKLLDITNQQATYSDHLKFCGSAVTVLQTPLSVLGPGDPMFTYFPGCEITGIDGRGVTFAQRPVVVRVCYHLNTFECEMVLDDKFRRSVVGAPGLSSAETLSEKKFGVAGITPAYGAQKVPYIQGASALTETQKLHYESGGQ